MSTTDAPRPSPPPSDENAPGPDVSTPGYWEDRYRLGEDGWEAGAAAPPLARAVEALGNLTVHGDAVVLGCGRGHEARLLAARGANHVVAVDFAPSALAEARRLTEGRTEAPAIEWRAQDLFSLGETDPARFGIAVEHTCFCAIDPARRLEWARVVGGILRPGGILVGLFYAHGKPGGPPFTTSAEEVVKVLESAAGLRIESVESPSDSIERRRGIELLVVARRP